MPTRRTEVMQSGRLSIPGCVYFLTFCLRDRGYGLTDASTANLLLQIARSMDEDGSTHTFAFTVMPDHLHWLFRLGERLELGQLVAKIKGLSRRVLVVQKNDWQRNYYEHRLRPEDSIEDYALYIFLNPYRAGLLQPHEAWPCWWTVDSRALQFVASLNPNGSPPPEWIGEPVPLSVKHGE